MAERDGIAPAKTMTKKEDRNGLPVLAFGSREEFEAWLAREHETSSGLWLKFAKKSSGGRSVSKGEAIASALCYGWIDGQLAPVDERHWLTHFTPRKPQSKWSQINRERAVELIAAGRMRAAGALEIERAKSDGRWDGAYAPQSRAEAPKDFLDALSAAPAAASLFERLDGANRYAVLYRVNGAKPKARAALIARLVNMLARGQTIHPESARARRSTKSR